MKRRLLWIGDATVDSGFARITHQVLDVLRHTWEVHCLALNYWGDPHDLPYKVWSCLKGGDGFGVGRTAGLVQDLQPAVVVVLNDPWNIQAYLERIGNVPTVASVAVDGKNCQGRKYLSGLAHTVFWTQFGLEEARAGGYTGPASVIPLGVDLNIYQPVPKRQARETMGLRNYVDHFIVGTVNRNQDRKRFDLLIQYFAEWVHTRRVDDAILYIHRAPTGDQAFDLQQLAEYYRIANRFADPIRPLTEKGVAHTLAMFDVFLSASTHEGWSLPTMEAMAVGTVPVVGDWAALNHATGWPSDGAVLVPCTSTTCTEGMGASHPNVIGGVPDREDTINALDRLYRDHDFRACMRERAAARVAAPAFRWPAIGEAYGRVLEDVLRATVTVPTEEAVTV